MKRLDSLRECDSGRDVFFISNASLHQTKTGKDYYNLVIRDATMELTGKVWNTADVFCNLNEEKFVVANYTVSSYAGELQLTLTNVQKADPSQYTESDYFPCSKYGVDEMYNSLLKYLNLVQDVEYKKLIQHFLAKEGITQRLRDASGAVSIHHAFVGGWLQHTLSVVKLCYACSKQYEQIDSSLLLTAAFFHDVGKLNEITPFPDNTYSDEGVMFGHVVYGSYVIRDLCIELGISEKKRDNLLHCIIAHHGELEWGSPKKPVLLEALVLSYADNLDSKVEIFLEALDRLPDEQQWSGFSRYLGTSVGRTQ